MKTENVVGIVGLIALVGLVTWYSVRYDDLRSNANLNSLGTAVAAGRLPPEVIAQHRTAADCWITIRFKVYNVTDYLARHPGGAERITPYCGQDATSAFATKGSTNSTHTSLAEVELNALYVGEAAVPSVVAPSNQGINSNVTTSGSAVYLSVLTVAQHNQSADCWIIVSGGVYNVTGFLAKHPGGAGRITPYCGKDATTAFATQDGTGQHSSTAAADLAGLRLGSLGSTAAPEVIQQTNTNAAATPTGTVEDEREEEDDD